MFQKLELPTLGQGSGFDSNSARGWFTFFLAVFQKLKPRTLGQGLIQTVQGGGLHFSGSVSMFEISNFGPRFDSNSAMFGGKHFSSSDNFQHWVRV